MKYDPRLHHRRSIRLKGYDYSSPRAYFVTLCTYCRECLFGDIADDEMRLNEWGKIVAAIGQQLPRHFPRLTTDAFVVMPNHLHGLLIFTAPDKGEASAANESASSNFHSADASPLQTIGTQPGSLGAIVQNFKSITTRRLNILCTAPGAPVWQRNYHEHIVRNERELNAIRRYIQNNPLQWALDRDNLQNTRRLPPPQTIDNHLTDITSQE